MGGALWTTFPMLPSSNLGQSGMLVSRMKESLLAFLSPLPPSPLTFLCCGLLLPALALPCDLTLGSLCPNTSEQFWPLCVFICAFGGNMCACVHMEDKDHP